MAEQWRITWYEEGEVLYVVEVAGGFADAWALTQPYPYPDEDELPWQWLPRADAQLQFANGTQSVVVAWVGSMNRIVVERL